jgi:hypothetical protein
MPSPCPAGAFAQHHSTSPLSLGCNRSLSVVATSCMSAPVVAHPKWGHRPHAQPQHKCRARNCLVKQCTGRTLPAISIENDSIFEYVLVFKVLHALVILLPLVWHLWVRHLADTRTNRERALSQRHTRRRPKQLPGPCHTTVPSQLNLLEGAHTRKRHGHHVVTTNVDKWMTLLDKERESHTSCLISALNLSSWPLRRSASLLIVP